MGKDKGKKTRMKIEAPVRLKDVGALDEALYEIAQMRQECKRIDAETDERINEIKDEARRAAEPIRAKIERIESAVVAFVDYHREELLPDRKSLELNFGVVGFRQSTRISVSVKSTLEKLKALGMSEAVRVTEQVDKTAMADWPEERLALVDAKRVVDDKFFYEIKEDAVAERVSGTVRRVSA